MKVKVFLFFAIISLLIVSVSGYVLFKKSVSSFDIFTPKENMCVPYNLFVKKGVKDYSVEISWSTKGKCYCFIQYGKDANNLEMIGTDSLTQGKSREHQVILEKLSSKEKYYFIINSDNQSYGNNGSPIEISISKL